MKKIISILLTCVILITGIFCQVPSFAAGTTLDSIVANDVSSGHVAYLDEYKGYNNAVGCLNANGTKTVYLFGEGVNQQTVESVTGLAMDEATASTLSSSGQTLDSIYDATVYSGSAY